jgi:hypothetical protein
MISPQSFEIQAGTALTQFTEVSFFGTFSAMSFSSPKLFPFVTDTAEIFHLITENMTCSQYSE